MAGDDYSTCESDKVEDRIVTKRSADSEKISRDTLDYLGNGHIHCHKRDYCSCHS